MDQERDQKTYHLAEIGNAATRQQVQDWFINMAFSGWKFVSTVTLRNIQYAVFEWRPSEYPDHK